MKSEVLAIIPCYNEGESIKETIESLRTEAPDVDYIVVNDGSRDNTVAICTENGYPFIDIPFNLGLANAVQTGMRYAHTQGYAMALQFDGDGQHMPRYISDMRRAMAETGADIVIASRYTQSASSSLRGFGGGILRAAIKISTGKRLTDPTSGMRMFNGRMIERFATHMNYGPEPDTLAYLIGQGARVVEIPASMQERKAGKSYLSTFKALNYMLHMFVSILIIRWFRKKERDN